VPLLLLSALHFSDYYFCVHHPLTRLTGNSLRMQWPLTYQLHGSFLKENIFLLRIKLLAYLTDLNYNKTINHSNSNCACLIVPQKHCLICITYMCTNSVAMPELETYFTSSKNIRRIVPAFFSEPKAEVSLLRLYGILSSSYKK
jgi:hypothetical protein